MAFPLPVTVLRLKVASSSLRSCSGFLCRASVSRHDHVCLGSVEFLSCPLPCISFPPLMFCSLSLSLPEGAVQFERNMYN